MSQAGWPAFLVILMCVMVAVDAQPTVDNSAFCESSSLDEAVNLIREDVKDVKNLLGSNQQQSNPSSISKKDLEDLIAACASSQQGSSAVDTPSLCE